MPVFEGLDLRCKDNSVLRVWELFQNNLIRSEKSVALSLSFSHYTRGYKATHYALRTTHYSLLTTHYTLLSTHYSLYTTHYSLYTMHYSLPTTHYTLLTTHYALRTTLINMRTQYLSGVSPPADLNTIMDKLTILPTSSSTSHDHDHSEEAHARKRRSAHVPEIVQSRVRRQAETTETVSRELSCIYM